MLTMVEKNFFLSTFEWRTSPLHSTSTGSMANGSLVAKDFSQFRMQAALRQVQQTEQL